MGPPVPRALQRDGDGVLVKAFLEICQSIRLARTVRQLYFQLPLVPRRLRDPKVIPRKEGLVRRDVTCQALRWRLCIAGLLCALDEPWIALWVVCEGILYRILRDAPIDEITWMHLSDVKSFSSQASPEHS